MPIRRHPNVTYPNIDLKEAIAKTKLIFAKYSVSPTGKYEIALAMSYSSLNGFSYTIISALLQYGLLEPFDKQLLMVSQDAVNIISHQEKEKERVNTVRKLAIKPAMFNEVFNTYPNLDSLSYDSLKTYLENNGFNHREIDSFIRSYRSTIEFVEEETAKPTSGTNSEQQIEVSMPMQPNNGHNFNSVDKVTNTVQEQENESWKQMLSLKLRTCEIRMLYNGTMSQKVIDQIIAHLNLLRESYSEE